MALPVIGALLTAGMGLIDKFYPDESTKAEAKMKLMQLQQEGNIKEMEAELAKLQALAQVDVAQANVNSVEANSTSWFASNWRPAVGWTCTAGFATNLMLLPILNFGVNVYNGISEAMPIASMPPLDLTDAGMLLAGMLGLATLRTFEKVKTKS